MPYLPPRLCAGGCGTLTQGGRCPACAKAKEQRRHTSTGRGYGTEWGRFRVWFIRSLVHGGVVPCCGARLPGASPTTDSLCLASGLLTYASLDGSSLHLDHTPPLAEWERPHIDLVCDALRVQLLCAECHAHKHDPGRGQVH